MSTEFDNPEDGDPMTALAAHACASARELGLLDAVASRTRRPSHVAA